MSEARRVGVWSDGTDYRQNPTGRARSLPQRQGSDFNTPRRVGVWREQQSDGSVVATDFRQRPTGTSRRDTPAQSWLGETGGEVPGARAQAQDPSVRGRTGGVIPGSFRQMDDPQTRGRTGGEIPGARRTANQRRAELAQLRRNLLGQSEIERQLDAAFEGGASWDGGSMVAQADGDMIDLPEDMSESGFDVDTESFFPNLTNTPGNPFPTQFTA